MLQAASTKNFFHAYQQSLAGGGEKGLSKSIKKQKFMTKIIFSDVELNSKKLWKMISADNVKANKTSRKKDLVAVSYKFS